MYTRPARENFGILKSALIFIVTWINTRICKKNRAILKIPKFSFSEPA